MTDIILVLTEDTLLTADVAKIVGLYGDDDLTYRVLVPADTHQSLLGALFEHLDSGQFKQAWEDATEEAASRLGGNAELWKAFGDAAMAVRAVVQTGDESASAAATEELIALRKRLYGLLADGPA